jgi:hypothetical protein
LEPDENIEVRQRNMSDAVTIGIASGTAASFFVLLAGLGIASVRDKLPSGEPGDFAYKYFTYGNALFWWMVILTGLVIGIFVYVKILSDYFLALPKQSTTTATVT